MSTLAIPDASVEYRRVYCQNPEVISLLSILNSSVDALLLPEAFPSDESIPIVIIGENPSIFTNELDVSIRKNQTRLIYVLRNGSPPPREAGTIPIFSFVVPPLQEVVLQSALSAAFDNLLLARSQMDLQAELMRARGEMDELAEIGIALSTQRDTESLLNMILWKSREITCSDAGSLYLVEDSDKEDEKRLRFKLIQNDSLKVSFNEFTLPIDASSVAGYAALTGEMIHLEDAQHLLDSLPFRFNSQFDLQSGYRTKSMLVVPMKNPQGGILGVVQLINCKRDRRKRVSAETTDSLVTPYPESLRNLVTSLVSQAAVALVARGLGETSIRAKPDFSAEARRVYCQNPEVIKLLSRESSYLEVVPLEGDFPADETISSVVIGENPEIFTTALWEAIENNRTRVIYLQPEEAPPPVEAGWIPVFSYLVPPLRRTVLESTIRAAFDNLKLAQTQAELQLELQMAHKEIAELNEIGIALSTLRDTEGLLDMILRKSREITSSDAGSLYLVEETDSEKRLRFKLTQNHSMKVSLSEFTVPINASSIAGYVALTGEIIHLEDVYHIPASLPFRFNVKFDQDSGYRTKSMLVVPMKNPQGEILGVVQLINCKRDRRQRIDARTADLVIIPYPEARRSLVSSLASQAAVAIENNRLYESIQTLFEGFVKASVVAIESRDPTTSGHSFRVADLTVGLAEAVDGCDVVPFRDLKFSRSEMKEIRYASLLHDFGKVGVREEVLVKAKKLYPQQLEVVQQRFDYVRKAVQQEHTERKLAYLLAKGRDEYLATQEHLDGEMAERLRELDEYLQFVLQCNEPTVLPAGNFQRLADLAGIRYEDWGGQQRTLISPQEVGMLSIPKGSLDEKERLQIESHVVHTFNFLSQIPWTKDIRNIPLIARAHHEKLNGTGYPYKLTEAEIKVQ